MIVSGVDSVRESFRDTSCTVLRRSFLPKDLLHRTFDSEVLLLKWCFLPPLLFQQVLYSCCTRSLRTSCQPPRQ